MPLQRPRCGARPRWAPGHQGRGRRHLVPGVGRGRAPRPLGAPARRGAQRGGRGRPGRARSPRRAPRLGRAEGDRTPPGEVACGVAATARHQVPARARGPDGRAPHDRGRRRLPARARPQGEPRRPARRERAARHLRLRAAAGRLCRPGLARRGGGAAHHREGRAAPHGPARARQAPAAGPGSRGRGARLPRCRRAHARRLDGGPPDCLGERRRLAAAAALGSHPATETPLRPRHTRRSPAARTGRPRPRHGRGRRRDRAHAPGARLQRRVAAPAPGRHRGGTRPAHRQGLAAPAGRPHAPAR